MILREEKEWKNKQLLPGQGDNVTGQGWGRQYFSCKGSQFCFKGKDEPETYSLAVFQDPDSLEHSITRLTGTQGGIMLILADACDSCQPELGLCGTLPQFYAELSSAQVPHNYACTLR